MPTYSSYNPALGNPAQGAHSHGINWPNQSLMSHSHSVYDPGHAHGLTNPYRLTLGRKPVRNGKCVPQIDIMISNLHPKAKESLFQFQIYLPENDSPMTIDLPFHHLSGDDAIAMFKDYHPIYGGKPKKIAMQLLEGCSKTKLAKAQGLIKCGLAYPLPALIGVRSWRQRTSSAGLDLLDFWADKYPEFERFRNAYVRTTDRNEIRVECFDFVMGNLPKSYRELEAANAEGVKKVQARRYRQMLRDKKRKEALEHMQRQQEILMQQQYQSSLHNQQYQNALHNQQMYANTAAGLPITPATGGTGNTVTIPGLLGQMKNKFGY